jgi:hypothetical protein
MTATTDQPIPYVVTDRGRAYVRALVRALEAGSSTWTAIECAEQAHAAGARRICPVCDGEDGEHSWEVHTMEARA